MTLRHAHAQVPAPAQPPGLGGQLAAGGPGSSATPPPPPPPLSGASDGGEPLDLDLERRLVLDLSSRGSGGESSNDAAAGGMQASVSMHARVPSLVLSEIPTSRPPHPPTPAPTHSATCSSNTRS